MSSDDDNELFSGNTYTRKRQAVSLSSSHIGVNGEKNAEGLDGVIQVMNQLYDIFNQIHSRGDSSTKLDLPQIVVCGSQSAGKTSVLERILREEFLPRGESTQTRCPIVLQLFNTTGGSKRVKIIYDKFEKSTDKMDEVKAEIEKINRQIVDSNCLVSETPLTLKLYSPDVPNLTMVDLPGLIENTATGQPDEVQKINELVHKYISNKKSIILAISAANVDIENSKSISLSKKVDVNEERTLGVLTKLDSMDDGTNATRVLLGERIKLRLGIIGVVNRSYKDVQNGKNIQDQLATEKKFLEERYPSLASTNGIPYLIERISELLMKEIQRSLPTIKKSVAQLIKNQQQLLRDMEKPKFANVNKVDLLYSLLTKFIDTYRAQIDGCRRNLNRTSLTASAKVKLIFDVKLKKAFDVLTAGSELSDDMIDLAIHSNHGIHSRHIDYDDTFQDLVKEDISRLSTYIKECANEVCGVMQDAIETSWDEQAKLRCPILCQKIEETVLELIDERFEDCQRYLEDYLNAEVSIARTIDGEFRDKKGDCPKPSEEIDKQPDKSNTTEYAYVDEGSSTNTQVDDPYSGKITLFNAETMRANVRRDIQVYFDREKRQIMEHVAKGIVYKLVYGTSNTIAEFLLTRLSSADAAELLRNDEAENLARRRDEAEQLLNDYVKARSVIDEIQAKVRTKNI